jgi:streptomycin 6-kinase
MTPQQRLRAWGVEPTGEPWSTGSSELAAGVRDGLPVIVKVARIEEERRGNRLMAWWSRCGGLPVLEAEGDAILMPRAPRVALELPIEEADQVLVATALRLHALPPPPDSVGLVPLRTWFTDLVDRPQRDPLLDRAASIARDLLTETGPSVVLHGDLHHGNVLELDGRWVAIDPKALIGHPAFDVANVLCNPSEAVAIERLEPRLDSFADRLGLGRDVLEAWGAAWCGLSLTWSGGAGSGRPDAARHVATRLLARR